MYLLLAFYFVLSPHSMSVCSCIDTYTYTYNFFLNHLKVSCICHGSFPLNTLVTSESRRRLLGLGASGRCKVMFPTLAFPL